jgi:hypothetical protein
MKNLIKYGFIALVICFFTACTETVVVTKEEKQRMEQQKALQAQSVNESEYEVIILDGCEYYRRGSWSDAGITHKGNCKNPIHNCR